MLFVTIFIAFSYLRAFPFRFSLTQRNHRRGLCVEIFSTNFPSSFPSYFVINASLFRFQLNDLRAFKTDLSDSLVERKRDNGEPMSCLSRFTLALASV